MGTWGIGTFESDEAQEWAAALVADPDPIEVLEYAVAGEPDGLSELDELFVLCTAEALIAILQRPRPGVPIHFDDPVTLEGGAVRLVPRCLEHLRAIRQRTSGYRALWFDSSGNPSPEWDAHVDGLVEDLEAA